MLIRLTISQTSPFCDFDIVLLNRLHNIKLIFTKINPTLIPKYCSGF